MGSNFETFKKSTFDFIPRDEEPKDEGHLFSNCRHCRLKYEPAATVCHECGVPHEIEGVYWPNETMRELEQ